jgi:hypothetical protein
MIEYKGYFMSGTALMIHPNSPDWRALGTVFAKTPQGAVVEVERVGGAVFTSKDAAERHGLILCQTLIEEKLEEAQDPRQKVSVTLLHETRTRLPREDS